MENKVIWFRSALLPDGWADGVRLRLNSGKIASIETGTKPDGSDETHAFGLPGLSNVHSHAFQYAMAGLTETASDKDDNFWSWRDIMYRFVGEIEPHHLEAVASQAYCAMLEAGFTHVGEFHYLHKSRSGRFYGNKAEMAAAIAAAAAETGIGLTLLPVLYTSANFGGKAPTSAQRRFTMGVDDYLSLVDQARQAVKAIEAATVGIAPHSLRAVTLEQLRTVADCANEGVIHIHVAEQLQEVADCLAWCGRRPVELLLGEVSVDRRWCLVHATHTTQKELRDIAHRGAVVGLCPVTEANLGDGIFDGRHFLDCGGVYAIGSDSNVSIGIPQELSLLEYSQRLSLKQRNTMAAPGTGSGRSLFEAALRGGQRALRGPDGGIRVGGPATFISLRPARATMPNRDGDTALNSWIFSAGSYAVDAVWVGGRKHVKDGKHASRGRIGSRYDLVMRELLDA